MKKIIIGIVILLSGFTVPQAQLGLSNVSLSIGQIRNSQSDYGNTDLDQFAFYPEISVGGNFFLSQIEWQILFSYFNDGIEWPSIHRDATTVTFENYFFGVKFYYHPQIHFLGILNLQPSISTGVIYNIEKNEYLSSIHGILPDFKEYVFMPHLGLHLSYPLIESIRVLANAGSYIDLRRSRGGRLFWSVGLKYEFMKTNYQN